jgi:hypothetical protein
MIVYILFELKCEINTHMNANEAVKKISYSLPFTASNQKDVIHIHVLLGCRLMPCIYNTFFEVFHL